MKKLLLLAAALAVIIQFIPAPPKTNPQSDPARAFSAVMKPPAAVQNIFHRACFDCHSNETIWPWYANIAPVSWPVRKHVEDGRKHINFSEWLKPGEPSFSNWSDLEAICKAVREKTMPLPYYDWLHPQAKLSAEDRQTVCQWVDAAITRQSK